MLKTINTFIFSLSIGLFCIGINLYINLHLGYEFLSIAIALEIASVLIAVAVNNNIKNLNIEVFSLAALSTLMVSPYLLFTMNFSTVYNYFIALLCVVVPIVLLVVMLINSERKVQLDSNPIKIIFFSSSVGVFASLTVAHFVYNREGLEEIFMFSSGALTIAIVLSGSISNVIKISVLCLFVGSLLTVNADLNMRLASWSLSDKPVSKKLLNLLKNPEQSGILVENTYLKDGSRVDVVTNRRSRKEGGFWVIHDANIFVPFVLEADSSISWWQKRYPLMIFPFELENPSKVLTIASAMGADVNISQQYYGAETTSVYSDCLSFNSNAPCDGSALNTKLEAALNSEKRYDLISFSIYNEIVTPFVGASAQHEAIHTIEVFQNLYDSLNDGGLLAVNARNQTMLRKSLSYVWTVMSTGDDERVITFEKNIRVLAINKYNLKDDAYNYSVLVSKSGFTSEDLQKINSFVQSKPVSKIMYGTTGNNVPDKLTVSSAISALTKLSSREFKKFINLEPSSIVKPGYFNLSKSLHPFLAVLSAIFISLGLYGLIVAHGSSKSLDAAVSQRGPGLSILLFQALLCVIAIALVLYAIVLFTSASLGYSSMYASLLMVSTLIAFAVPHVFLSTSKRKLRGTRGLWIYLINLLLCMLVLVVMNQSVIILFSAGVQAVVFVLAVLLTFCSGVLHRQTAMFIERLYPEVNFWFWCMASVGIVLGVIVAKYILIKYDLEIVVQTAMVIFVFMAFIAWWSLATLQGDSDNKTYVLEVPD